MLRLAIGAGLGFVFGHTIVERVAPGFTFGISGAATDPKVQDEIELRRKLAGAALGALVAKVAL